MSKIKQFPHANYYILKTFRREQTIKGEMIGIA